MYPLGIQVFLKYSIAIPLVFLWYSSGIPSVFLWYSSRIPSVFLRCSLNIPFVEVQATVATMSGKLSSLKRASRSLAKTGLFGRPLGCLFPRVFLRVFLLAPGAVLARFGLPFEVLWEVFLVTLPRFGAFAGLHSLSSQNLTLPRLGGPVQHFFVDFSRCCFQGLFFSDLIRFLMILGSLWVSFWLPSAPL
jgi:hypothetical protein